MVKMQALGVGVAVWLAVIIVGGIVVGNEPGTPATSIANFIALALGIAAGVSFHRRNTAKAKR